jgi:hypothetical protein
MYAKSGVFISLIRFSTSSGFQEGVLAGEKYGFYHGKKYQLVVKRF